MSLTKVYLRDVLDVKRGASLSGDYYSESGKYIRLTLGNFNYPNGGFKENTSKKDIYFTGEIKSEFILKKGDIITPLTEQVSGLLGETARIPEDNKYIQSGDVGLVVPNELKLNREFAYYLISSPIIKKQLNASSQQTKIRHTSPEYMRNCIAWIPSEIETQKNIANILDDINSKIENNNQIISELQSIAKTIYGYWFLQFDFPNEKDNPYKSSGGKMIWSDELKREIPDGWFVSTLSKYCVFKNGINYEKNQSGDTEYNIVNVRDISASSLIINNYNLDKITLPKTKGDSYLVQNNDILISRSASAGSIRILLENQTNTIYSGFIISCTPNDPKLRNYLLYCLKLYEGTSITNPDGTIFGNITQDTLSSLKIVVPSTDVILKFNQIVNPLFDLMRKSIQENNELTTLRDFLLPLLMNGQAKIVD